MDFIFSDCYHWNVQDISQPQNNVNQETGTSSYAREALTQVKENQPLPDENDFIEFWNRNYQNYYEHSERKQSSCLGNNSVERNDFGELDEILNHVPRLPSYMQGTEGKKMNFIMIATTLDKKTITENLEKTLDKTKFQALPLSFEAQTMEHIYDDSLEPATEKRKRNVQLYEEQQCTRRRLKRKHFEEEEKRRKFEKEDEMLFTSKRDTKCRMSWLTTKRTDYNEEDKDLEQQVKMLIQTKQL
ncbi:Hypothetical predicted protein [Paramuricea clavata]|uniref:Uncharacterized protein n=1 Tax=Paramuricea clavata TaxID=317549 RepID=A0A7D9DHK8_PARCT|nr:Hypothetical predicted protein [Paramuricea clavata]